MSLGVGHVLPLIARAEERADPLKCYRSAGWHAEWVTRHLAQCEIYAHGANKCSKTTTAAAIAVALCRGVPSLAAFDGTPIPLPTPKRQVRGAIGMASYKLGEDSIIVALRAMLGTWGHHEVHNPEGTEAIYVRHTLDSPDSDWHEWSKLSIYPYKGPDPHGPRLDFWIADEPPTPGWLQAIRNRGRRGAPLYGLIAGTPIDARIWEPLLAQYPGPPLVIQGGRARIQASVYDNRFLHLTSCPGYAGKGYCSCACPDIVAAEQANAGSIYAKAALFGEHVNIVGGCPYDEAVLNRWDALCVDPREVIRFTVQGERTTARGYETASIICELEVWEDDDPDDEYIVIVDPARGLDDGRHDPDGLHVRSRRTRALVARANQFLGAWGLGAAGVEVAKAYHNAELYVARGGGYGDAVLSAARVLGYWNLGRDRKSEGGRTAMLGVNETGSSRHQAMNAVAAMLQRGETRIPSRAVIRCFRNVIVNRDGKIEARSGYNDEDLILTGHGERILDWLGPLPERIQSENKARDVFNRAWRADFGLPVDGRSNGKGGMPMDDGRWENG